MHPNDISSATTSGVKAPNSFPWRHFNAIWGRNYVIVIFFTHYLWETMKWNQSFNLIKIYIYWRILSDQLVILISSRGRTTRFQIKCIARPGSTIYYYLHRYSISILVELDISTALLNTPMAST